jgi:hypothetical protein
VCLPHARAASQRLEQMTSPSPHSRRRRVRPQRHAASTATAHGPQSPGWHAAAQACPHGSGFLHVAPHRGVGATHDKPACASRPQPQRRSAPAHGQGGQAPAPWQPARQACSPHASEPPHGAAQRQARARQGSRRVALPQAHGASTRTPHGGHAPAWHGSWHACAQPGAPPRAAPARPHTAPQLLGAAPQRAPRRTRPQWQLSSTCCAHGAHAPAWHASRQTCAQPARGRRHGAPQECAASHAASPPPSRAARSGSASAPQKQKDLAGYSPRKRGARQCAQAHAAAAEPAAEAVAATTAAASAAPPPRDRAA